MKQENKAIFNLFILEAFINIVLAGILFYFDHIMAMVSDNTSESQLKIALVFNVYWWPLLLFVVTIVCAVAVAREANRQKLSVLAVIILIIDIFVLAFTLLYIPHEFAMSTYKLA